MRPMTFLVFFAIVFAVYSSINYYLFSRLNMVFPGTSGIALYVKIIFWFLVVSYFAGRFLERIWLSKISMGITIIGSYWLAAMLYLLIAVLLIDLIRLAGYFIPFLSSGISNHLHDGKKYLFWGLIAATGILMTYGYFNARRPLIRELEISIRKQAGNRKELNIVMGSDIHLGTMYTKKRLLQIVNQINSLEPDIILLAGDIIDEDLKPVIRKDLGSELKMLKAKSGVFAVTGNHEYIGGVNPAVSYLESHDIQLLRDTAVLIENSFYLIGREDRSHRGFFGKQRKALPDIMKGLNKDLPLILMDHQPFKLEESVENGIDVHLAGHTHNGQIWPLNYIIDAIYEVGWGYKNKSGTHVYVSSGIGTWGPPVRIGTRPEIIKMKLNFNSE